ncbi:LPD7 domain-containing protein [Aquabacterium sp.]|uniref:LPD7 domain-containing protein n=1 Tax=Aquabacterium sp. TaxID=1872578 RepID=UPI002BE27D9A|nr:LPD7 domain-containing protein [Aquabacterium sp.]HSW04333.1 LPD7 domain-containing protein [Aquabacterium sp.]
MADVLRARARSASERSSLVRELAAAEVAWFFTPSALTTAGHDAPNRILGIGDAHAVDGPAVGPSTSGAALNASRRVIGHDYALRGTPGRVVYSEQIITLVSTSEAPAAVQAMLNRAVDRRWWCVWIQGSADFVRLASLAALARGVEVGALRSGVQRLFSAGGESLA